MAGEEDDARVQAQILARFARLDLTPDRLTTLSGSLSTLLALFSELRATDPGDREPPVITFDAEGQQ